MEKRREHLKVDQARPDKSMLFDQKAKEIAAALLYEMAPQEKKR